MTPHPYTEDQLVEQPAIQLFAELGWSTVSAMEEEIGVPSPRPSHSGRGIEGESFVGLGRETKSEVVLVRYLRHSLEKLNPALPAEAITTAIDELTRDRSAMSLAAANKEIYELLKQGVKVSVQDNELSPQPSPRGRESEMSHQDFSKGRGSFGGQKPERVTVIDWENPSNNEFLLVSQMTIVGQLYKCRPDLIGFVNDLPLVVIELKKPGVPAKQAFDDNLTSYKHAENGVPSLFWYNAFLIASNGSESRMGTITADWERYFEWKRIEREDETRRVSLEVMLRGTCEPTRLLDLVENFTLFSEHKAGLVKALAQNHQFLGVNNAITASMLARQEGHGRGGVFWQTQGSGKSFAMVFFAQKILRKTPGNWSFVVVTDRVELDDQIAKTFKACGAVSTTEADECHVTSGAHLRELLAGNHRYVFTLIHKFQSTEELCDRKDVIVLTDEAHRSQYDTLALNMRSALPNALFLAFTGTPLIAGEERTREVFGDYVSIYDFQQSVEDGATVPLFYENRTPALELSNPKLNADMYALIEEAELNAEQEKRLEKVLRKQYHILTRDDRLETVAKDIVQHFLGRGFQGKAMVVSIDKATALRMYTKVRRLWDGELNSAKNELGKYDLREEERLSLKDRLARLESMDMALIVSPGQNEVEQMKELGLDIVPHRKRMNDEDLDEDFKDEKHPLSLVFLCAMWLTGFDVPSCSTIYLDKPMRNHTLMQTIARANRVYPGKHSGLIVDYANVFASLEKALAIYGKGSGGATPVRDKEQLVEELRKAIYAASAFCLIHGVSLDKIEAATGFHRTELLKDAVNVLISPDSIRKEFLASERLCATLYKAVKPDPQVMEFVPSISTLTAISDIIHSRTTEPTVSIQHVMQDINRLLDESISGVIIKAVSDVKLDLSNIDFEALSKRFKQSKRRNTDIESLKAAVRAQLEKVIRFNPTRTDFNDLFQELIESYNNGSRNIEDLFNELVKLSKALSEEQHRHIAENLSQEELVIFDILTRPAPEMSERERDEVKKVATLLLERLKELLVLNWRQKSQARARVLLEIEDRLDAGLPRVYTPEIYEAKVKGVFEYVYESYSGDGVSVYALSA